MYTDNSIERVFFNTRSIEDQASLRRRTAASPRRYWRAKLAARNEAASPY